MVNLRETAARGFPSGCPHGRIAGPGGTRPRLHRQYRLRSSCWIRPRCLPPLSAFNRPGKWRTWTSIPPRDASTSRLRCTPVLSSVVRNYVAVAHACKINRLRIGPPSESRSEAFVFSRSCSRLRVSPGRIMCGCYIIPQLSALRHCPPERPRHPRTHLAASEFLSARSLHPCQSAAGDL